MINIKTKIHKFILILKEWFKGISDNFNKFYKINVLLIGIISCASTK